MARLGWSVDHPSPPGPDCATRLPRRVAMAAAGDALRGSQWTIMRTHSTRTNSTGTATASPARPPRADGQEAGPPRLHDRRTARWSPSRSSRRRRSRPTKNTGVHAVSGVSSPRLPPARRRHRQQDRGRGWIVVPIAGGAGTAIARSRHHRYQRHRHPPVSEGHPEEATGPARDRPAPAWCGYRHGRGVRTGRTCRPGRRSGRSAPSPGSRCRRTPRS